MNLFQIDCELNYQAATPSTSGIGTTDRGYAKVADAADLAFATIFGDAQLTRMNPSVFPGWRDSRLAV